MLFLSLLCVQMMCYAQQKSIEVRNQAWLGYFNQTRLTKHSGLWVDLHARFTGDFTNEKSLTIGRIGYTYYAGDARVTAGYAYATHYTHEESAPDIQEHRPWQQIQWVEKKNRFVMMQWLRLEERFRQEVEDNALTGDYDFNYRIRYNVAFTIPLKGKAVVAKTPFLFFNNEVFVNFGKEIFNNYFDQNRAFAGMGYQLKNNLNTQLGYMYVFQQRAQANQFIQINAIRLFIFHTLDFRKEEVRP